MWKKKALYTPPIMPSGKSLRNEMGFILIIKSKTIRWMSPLVSVDAASCIFSTWCVCVAPINCLGDLLIHFRGESTSKSKDYLKFKKFSFTWKAIPTPPPQNYSILNFNGNFFNFKALGLVVLCSLSYF